MRFELEDYHHDITDDEMIADVQRVAILLGKQSVTMYEYDDYGKYSSSTLFRHFGSWFALLDKAGLKRTRNLGITEEELFENIESVWTTLGRQPKYIEMNGSLSKYCVGTYEYRFGSWRKSLEAFVAYANAELDSDSNSKDSNPELQHLEDTQLIEDSVSTRHMTKRNVSHRLRFLVFKRDGFKCAICGKSPANHQGTELVADHRVAWSKGGETTMENLQTLCVQCNSGKSNLPMD